MALNVPHTPFSDKLISFSVNLILPYLKMSKSPFGLADNPGHKSQRTERIRLLRLVILLLAFALAGYGQTQGDALLRGFLNPPDSAKPRVWWHWMSGNITKEGIKADLEWMKRVGIGGFQNFDAGLNTPQIVDKRLVFMTPEWKDAFNYATTLADQLGLEMAIAGSPGWSESGGPWVPPAQAMKKYVWSETRVEGGRPFGGALPKPPSATGAYQPARRRAWSGWQGSAPGAASGILCRRGCCGLPSARNRSLDERHAA